MKAFNQYSMYSSSPFWLRLCKLNVDDNKKHSDFPDHPGNHSKLKQTVDWSNWVNIGSLHTI